MRKVFIAATQQNDGKTTVSLGLIKNLQRQFKHVAFIKPIGQRYLEEEGQKIDEDSLLIEEVCGIRCNLKDMSPVAVERGFTERYIENPNKKIITRQVKEAFRRVAKGQDFVVIEGTGHAGVGSVFDHSNATVARLLGAKVIIISSGGIGRPIDEIVLNQALFEREGVKVLGVIINKVLPTKFDKVNALIRKGLKRKGIRVLGVLPYLALLSYPTIEQILEETNFELLSGKEYLEQFISSIIVGAMQPQDAVRYVIDDTLLITPGDRDDLIREVLRCVREDGSGRTKISAIIISGDILPQPETLAALQVAKIPVLVAKNNTYEVATIIHDLTVKIRPRDTLKINAAVDLVKEHVDLQTLMKEV